jgi:hypothetical protein
MTFVIYKKIKSCSTREQAVAELFSLGAIVQGFDDFPEDNVHKGKVIADNYKIEEE